MELSPVLVVEDDEAVQGLVEDVLNEGSLSQQRSYRIALTFTGGLWKFPTTADNFLPRGP